MTTNIDRAADVIDAWTKQGNELNEYVGDPASIARRLAEAGLLAPDLPAPSHSESDGYALWKLDHIDISAETEIGKVYVDGNDITPKESREEAAALLAAADHAEGVGRADA